MKKFCFLFAFILFSCSSDEDTTYLLTIDNPYSDSAAFSQISLPDNNFTMTRDVQTFTIKGLSSTSDVRVTINFNCVSKDQSTDVLVNFYKDQTTTIKLTKILKSSQGCSLGFTVTYN